MIFRLRPITRWPKEMTPEPQRQYPRFDTSFGDTKALLEREILNLQRSRWTGTDECVIQLGIGEDDIRVTDGELRARAQVRHPGVIVMFDSKHGPLTYATDQFTSGNGQPGWHHNLRAIALSLEALRKVNRYGVANSGEQYVGWKALGSGSADDDVAMTVEQAARILHDAANPESLEVPYTALIGSPTLIAVAYRKASFATHPDHGGSQAAFDTVTKARDLLMEDHQ